MNIAFGMDSILLPPLGEKDTTIRAWSEKTIGNWQETYDREPHKEHIAVNRHFCSRGGRQTIGHIILKERPFTKFSEEINEEDFIREGSPHEDFNLYLNRFRHTDNLIVVIRFNFYPNRYFSKLISEISYTKRVITRQKILEKIMSSDQNEIDSIESHDLNEMKLENLAHLLAKSKSEFDKHLIEINELEQKKAELHEKINNISSARMELKKRAKEIQLILNQKINEVEF